MSVNVKVTGGLKMIVLDDFRDKVAVLSFIFTGE